MDQLDREIEEAARAAAQKVRRGRLSMAAALATFFLVAGGGLLLMLELFPEPQLTELEAHQLERKATGGDPSAETIVNGFAAHERDQGRLSWKAGPVVVAAFAAALFVLKRTEEAD
jgi:hypothetical protein